MVAGTGGTSLCLAEWQAITSDREILNIIKKGIEIEFITIPRQTVVRETVVRAGMESVLDQEIAKFLQKGIIVPTVKEEGDYYSTVFLREKREPGKYRLIINLKPIKQFIVYRHFKMATVQTCMHLIQHHSYMAALDLKDAYYSLRVAKKFQKFLKFRWRGRSYKYVVLPMGLAPGPRLFTKVTKPIIATLQGRGFTVCPYLDDLFIVADTALECSLAVSATIELFTRLGFVVNIEKSTTTPTQVLDHLGCRLDSVHMTASLTDARCQTLLDRSLPLTGTCTIQQVMSFVGTVESCVPGVKAGHLHKYHLEIDKNEAFKLQHGKLSKTMVLSPGAIKEMNWWVHVAPTMHNPLYLPPINRTLQTDASNRGWGACVVKHGRSTVGTQGSWSPVHRKLHINAKELWGAFYGLQAFFQNDYGAHVLIQLDNMTAVAFINKMGGTKSDVCCDIAQQIWHWALAKGLWLTADFLPGADNVTADRLSRHIDDRLEWQLQPDIFHKICSHFDLLPDIDLFASKDNAQLPSYMSFIFDTGAVAVNAFHHSWTSFNLPYIFCPFSVIPRVIQRLAAEKGRALMVVPLWMTAPWFAGWVAACQRPPLLLPPGNRILSLPMDRTRIHPMGTSLRLICSIVSFSAFHRTDCQRTPYPPSCVPGDHAHKHNTLPIWPNGLHLLQNGDLLPLIPLK